MEQFEQIYRQYALPVKKYVMSLCHNDALADDVTADTFCKALTHLDTYDPRGKVLTWLCSIARNTYLDAVQRRDNQTLPLPETLPGCAAPEQALEDKQERLTLYRNLQRLSPDYRSVLYLRLFADLSFAEIGEVLDKSENWARVSFYRGKNQLKGMMPHEI
ncbi:MAG: sigma-70 family RNA polymerase sigma factor [Oscillospiraceae bacterium]|nr:sigma-70 family RNA polymerase sigma factor [Oscillospiraceae bacterium]